MLIPTTVLTSTGTSGPADGWTAAGETWTYASADSPTFTFTVAADVTAKYSVGMRVKLTQTTDKYFIITAVSTFSGGNTTITVYGGTDYTLANAAITSPFWSMLKAPFGFPLDPSKWTVTLTDSSRQNAGALTQNVWSNPGSLSLSIPLGVWDVTWHGMIYGATGSSTNISVRASLSTSTSSESDTDLTGYGYMSSLTEHAHTTVRRKTLALAAKTTYFPIIRASLGAGSLSALAYLNDFVPLRVNAVCAYL